MSEQPHFDKYDSPLTIPPIRSLDSALAHISGNYIGVVMSFQRYLKEEFTSPYYDEASREQAADTLYLQLMETGALPDSDLFEDAPEDAIDSCRLAVFSEVMPLYRSIHAAHEFSVWLPRALTTILPASGRHRPDSCSLHDSGCEQGTICPVAYIASAVTDELMTPDFTSFDYVLDSTKAHDNAITLLQTVSRRRIISEAEKYRLVSHYEHSYQTAFPPAR